jgi:hypothetical protein
MPLRASMSRYFSAVVRNLLPSLPVIIVMVLGGAGRTNRIANHIPARAEQKNGAEGQR